MVEVVSFPGALPHTGEYGKARMLLGNIVDEFHDCHGFADASATEQANLAALGDGHDQIDDFDTRLKNINRGRLICVPGRFAMNRKRLTGFHRSRFVYRVA